MRRTIKTVLAAALLCTATCVTAGDAGRQPPMPSKEIKSRDTFMMEVESIDPKTGEMVLCGSKKKRLSLRVNRKRHNIKKIRPGDWLIVTVREEAAVRSARGGGEPASEAAEEVVAGPKTAKPLLESREVSRLRARVVAVDLARREVTLEGPHGHRRTIRVKEDLKHLENLRPGDTVTATITRIVVMKIRGND